MTLLILMTIPSGFGSSRSSSRLGRAIYIWRLPSQRARCGPGRPGRSRSNVKLGRSLLSGLLRFGTSNETTNLYRMFQKKSSPPPKKKTFWNIFTLVKSFRVKFCKFVGNSYQHIFANFCRFILIFHQMELIFPRVPIVFTLSSFEYSPIK